MGIKLSFEIISPLGPDDREMLTGLSIMVMAIANHELAKEHFPGTFPSPEEMAEEARRQAAEPMLCMAQGKGLDAGKSCVSEFGHKGRHRFLFILTPTEGLN
jgi:hypothetical protein